MESTSRPSVFSRLGFANGQQRQGGKRVEEERVVERVRGEAERRRRREGERRSDEGRRRRDFESGRRGGGEARRGEGRDGGGRESPRKREKDLGLSRRGSPIKKVEKNNDDNDCDEKGFGDKLIFGDWWFVKTFVKQSGEPEGVSYKEGCGKGSSSPGEIFS